MKTLVPTLLLVVSLIGCTTNGVFDPVKTQQVEAAIRPVSAALVRAAADGKPQYVPYIRAVGNIFCSMDTNHVFTPAQLLSEVNKLVPPSKDPVLLAARDLVTSLYGIYFSKTVVDLDQSKVPAFVANVICQGITSGLQ